MPDWIVDFLNTDLAWSWGNFVWNGVMNVVYTILTMTPKQFSPQAWAYLTDTLYPWFLSAGVALLNFFFLIGFVRQNTNLRDNITIETWIEGAIKVIIANAIMNNFLIIADDFLTLQVAVTKFVLGNSSSAMNLSVPEVDVGAVLFAVLGGVFYIIIAVACVVLVILEIIKRFLYLLLCIAGGPIAVCTLSGGKGIENTTYAWVKTFLTYCFQFVIIAMVLRLGTFMGSNLSELLQSNSGGGEIFDGFNLCLNNLIFMLFMTTAIKGSDNLIEKMYGLR